MGLESELSLLKATLEATADGLLVVDRDGRIVSFNQRLLEIWDIPSSVVEGRPYRDAVSAVLGQLENGAECAARLDFLMAHPEEESCERLRFRNGRVLERYSRPQRAGRQIVGRVFSYRDVSLQIHAEERLWALSEMSRLTAEARRDLATILETSAHKMAEYFGDGCMIRLLSGEDEELETMAYHHVDPFAKRVLRKFVVDMRSFIDDKASRRILRDMQPLLITGGPKVLGERIPPKLRDLLKHYPIHSWIVSPLRVAGTVIGFTSVFRYREGKYTREDVNFVQDVSDRIALAINDARLHAATRNALRMRDDFILLAAHELRTPLTTLNLEIELLARTPQSSDGLVARIGSSSARLSQVVEEMLKLALLAKGDTDLNPKKMNFSRLVREVAARQSRNQENVSVLIGRPVNGFWDRAKIEEVVECLISAANSLNTHKPLRVQVTRTHDHARLEVRVGSPASPKERTRPFPSGERAATAEQFGLRVYVAHEIVESHGGRFRVQGDVGGDFAFIVELPLQGAKPQTERGDLGRRPEAA